MDYMSEVLKICGVAIVCVTCMMLFGRDQSGLGSLLRIGGGVVIFGALVMMLGENFRELYDLVGASYGEGGYAVRSFSLMLKALGIALCGKLCADVCRDCGESTLAGGVESVARAAIFSLCIPVIADVLEYAAKILEIGG